MASGPVTRLRLIAVAERLFAERGTRAVSLREIAVAAQQRNSHAVQYHFGTKQNLVDAIFEHRMEGINARRTAMLDDLDRRGLGTDPYALTRALVLPMSELLDEGGHPSWYLRFCTQAVYQEDPDIAGRATRDLGGQEWTSGVLRIRERVYALLAHLPADVREDRWAYYTGSITHALADREARIQYAPSHRASPLPLFVSGLVDAAVAVLTAPVGPDTLAHAAVSMSA